MSQRICLLAGLLSVGAAACGTRGELGKGYFQYRCVDDSDVACSGSFDVPDVPAAVAVEGRAQITFDPDSGGPASVVPVGTRFARVDAGIVTFLDEGVVTLAAESRGTTVDFVETQAYVVSALELSGPNTTMVGGFLTLNAVPKNDHAEPLAGALEYQWSSSDEAIATVTTDGGHAAYVTGVSAGAASITGAAAGVTRSYSITISGLP